MHNLTYIFFCEVKSFFVRVADLGSIGFLRFFFCG